MASSKALAIFLIIGFFACEAMALRSYSSPSGRRSKTVTIHSRNLAEKLPTRFRSEINLLERKPYTQIRSKPRKANRKTKSHSHRRSHSYETSTGSSTTEYTTVYKTVESETSEQKRKGWSAESYSAAVHKSHNTVNLSDSSNFRERIIETTTVTEITVKSFITEHKERIRRIVSGKTAFEATATLKSKDLGNESYSESDSRAEARKRSVKSYPTKTEKIVWKKPHKVPVTVSKRTGLYVVSGSSDNPEVLRLTDSDLSWTHKEFVVSTIPTWLEKTGRVNSRRRSASLSNSRYNSLLNSYLFD